MTHPKSDRGLLELAAKAAGKIYVGWDSHEEYLIVETGYVNMTAMWNPLEDDGDSFRLQSLFRMSRNYIHNGFDNCVVMTALSALSDDVISVMTPFGDDETAAERRCAVLLAAAIGESK